MTQHEIGEWHRATFPTASNARVLAKLIEEVGELVESVADGLPGTSEEIADVYIVLATIAERFGFDIDAAVEWKMRVNRDRTKEGRWSTDRNY